MNNFLRTAAFAAWLEQLSDLKGKSRILARINAASAGNFGDCEPVGEGVSEMRIDFGPGYRVYFMRDGAAVYLLLCAGDKSTQKADIAAALKMARQVKAERTALDQVKESNGRPRPKAKPAVESKGKARKG